MKTKQNNQSNPNPENALWSVSAFGDTALWIEYQNHQDHDAVSKVMLAAHALRNNSFPGVEGVWAVEYAICLQLNPIQSSVAESLEPIHQFLLEWTFDAHSLELLPMITLPVCYAEEFGGDLTDCAKVSGLTRPEWIQKHLNPTYETVFLGFSAGFPYMKGLPQELQLPRLQTPRRQVPKGSIAIAEQYVGIYPADLPGGWHIIGRTPVTLFDPVADPPSLFTAGTRVQFREIDRQLFDEWLKLDRESAWQSCFQESAGEAN